MPLLYYHFRYYLPLEKDFDINLNKLEFPLMICGKFIEIDSVVLEKDENIRSL